MAELTLKISKSSYQDRITILDAKLAALGDLLSEYHNLNNEVTIFMEERDDRFLQMQENVQVNIEAVRRAIGATQRSRDTLQKTLDALDDTGERMGNILKESISLAQNTIDTAIKASALID